jgi:hypothetical protein
MALSHDLHLTLMNPLGSYIRVHSSHAKTPFGLSIKTRCCFFPGPGLAMVFFFFFFLLLLLLLFGNVTNSVFGAAEGIFLVECYAQRNLSISSSCSFFASFSRCFTT